MPTQRQWVVIRHLWIRLTEANTVPATHTHTHSDNVLYYFGGHSLKMDITIADLYEPRPTANLISHFSFLMYISRDCNAKFNANTEYVLELIKSLLGQPRTSRTRVSWICLIPLLILLLKVSEYRNKYAIDTFRVSISIVHGCMHINLRCALPLSVHCAVESVPLTIRLKMIISNYFTMLIMLCDKYVYKNKIK